MSRYAISYRDADGKRCTLRHFADRRRAARFEHLAFAMEVASKHVEGVVIDLHLARIVYSNPIGPIKTACNAV